MLSRCLPALLFLSVFYQGTATEELQYSRRLLEDRPACQGHVSACLAAELAEEQVSFLQVSMGARRSVPETSSMPLPDPASFTEQAVTSIVRSSGVLSASEATAQAQAIAVSSVQLTAVGQLTREVLRRGDGGEGLIFAVICLFTVTGIFLLVLRDPSSDPASCSSTEDALRRCCPWPTWPSSTVIPPRSRQLWQQPGTGRRPVGRVSVGATPSAQSLLYAGPSPSPTAASLAKPPSPTEEWHSELPMIYPKLVMPVAHTRLAVPVEPLSLPEFEVDVLGLSGVPLLSANLAAGSSTRSIQITLHSVNNVIAVVTSALELYGADGVHFGKLVKEDRNPEMAQFALRDKSGRSILAISSTRKDGRDFKMTSLTNGQVVERATAVRRPRGKLPAEHYEIVANPNVDAVLVLACFLAVVVFELPPPSSGRPSTLLQSESPSLTSPFWPYPQ